MFFLPGFFLCNDHAVLVALPSIRHAMEYAIHHLIFHILELIQKRRQSEISVSISRWLGYAPPHRLVALILYHFGGAHSSEGLLELLAAFIIKAPAVYAFVVLREVLGAIPRLLGFG